MNKIKTISFVLIVAVLLIALSVFALAVPEGATVTPGAESRYESSGSPGQDTGAYAGNITELTVNSVGVTPSWQGYYGDVTGVFTLGDASDNIMYNWTTSTPSGEIFASSNNSVTWANIQCLNLTANGTYINEDGNPGTINQAGVNYTILENEFNINKTAGDGVNETFGNGSQPQGEGLTHDAFIVGSTSFGAGTCYSTHLFADSQSPEDGAFQQILLYEPSTQSVVFTTIINQDELGFDGSNHDFQMIVLEDGHEGDTSTDTYYFWAELE